MKWVHRALVLVLGILILAACNLPMGQPATQAPSVNQLAATIVAATLKAVATSTPSTTPFASPVKRTASAEPEPTGINFVELLQQKQEKE